MPAKRLFFALVPDDKTRRAIWRLTRPAVEASGGRAVRANNLHVTVAFLGNVELAAVQRAAGVGPFDTGAFALQLDHLECRRRGRVMWLAPSAVPAQLSALEQALWQQLAARGFERERRPYRPHMTLARSARGNDAEIAPVNWIVAELALVESVPAEPGRRYDTLATWSL